MKAIAILGNVAGFIFMVTLAADAPRNAKPWEWVVLFGFMALALLNVYLLSRNPSKLGRVARMVGYWLDAKEGELKAKATKETP